MQKLVDSSANFCIFISPLVMAQIIHISIQPMFILREKFWTRKETWLPGRLLRILFTSQCV